MFITLGFHSFFTNSTTPSPLADFVGFHFGHTGVTSSSLTSLSFVTIEGSVDALDYLADLFPLNSHFGHSDKLGVTWRLGCFLQQNLNYRRARFSNKQVLTISRVQRCMANRCRLLHLILPLKWLLHLMGSFLMQYVAVGYSFFHYLLLTLLKWLL